MASELGSFLRARRGRVDPRDHGLAAHGVRKVGGLRREEVAVLAAISVDYYTRLEQGRERNPSRQVLDALVETLALDEDGRDHLFRLAGLAPGRPAERPPPAVHPDLLRLMESWPATPALVLGPALDVLARNALARALFGVLAEQDNLARIAFSDPGSRRFYVDWHRAAEATVASLRASATAFPGDPRLVALVAGLEASSPEFAELWARQDVRGKRRDTKRLDHPDVGRLELSYETFDVRSAPGQQLVVYQAEPGSRSAQGLALLGSLAAGASHPG
jgi:transcriptional regulator with XRE-family HTH domain